MDVFLLILRLILAAVFAIAAFGKLFDRAGSEKAFADFGIPEPLRRPLSQVLPAAELIVAVLLLFVTTSWYGAVGAAALLIIFVGGMLYQMAQGKAPDCHCFGQLHSEPVGVSSVARNVVLIAMAGFLMGQGRGWQGQSLVNGPQDTMIIVIGLAMIALLGAIVLFLKQISDKQSEIVRRIEIMDLVAQSTSTVERENVSHPHEGLPIGAEFPNFELPGINGDVVTLDVIRSAKMPALFLFISPTCTPCKSLVPEFVQWQEDFKDKLNLVFISSGTPEENEEKFGPSVRRQLLLQEKREFAELVRAKWTPTAILVDANGRVASHAAAGDVAIRALVERLRSTDVGREFAYFASGKDSPAPNKVGEKVPDFELTDIDGRRISSESLRGKKTLLTFWGLGCGHCQNMLNDLREWDRNRSNGDPQMIVFSDGDIEGNKKLGLESPIITDEGYRTAAQLGMMGTPSAVLVNEQGIIISETAIGAPDIWALIGKGN